MQISTFMLVDNGMLGGSTAFARGDGEWPSWVVPIYKGKASAVGPIVVDLEAAYEKEQIDQAMALANALKPALHVSFIDTSMSLDQIVQHLKQFIFIVHEDGKSQSLRFADCVVLSHLASILAPAQWTNFVRPIVRWSIHDRSGLLHMLPPAQSEPPPLPFPLQLTRQQIDALDEALEPDLLLAEIKAESVGKRFPGTEQEKYASAATAFSMWRTAGRSGRRALKSFVEAALLTNGEILRIRTMPSLLGTADRNVLEERLRQLVADFEERRANSNAPMEEQS